MRMRKKRWAAPELNACAYYITDSDQYKGRWRTLFEKDQPLYLELGCGKGVSTAKMAHENKQINFIAIDLISDVLGTARRNIAAEYADEPVGNIVLTSKECELIYQTFAPEDKIERIIISFCNPWNERLKHRKHRLTHTRQLMQYRDFLVDGGEIWFKTDDDTLFDDSMEYFRESGFGIKYITRDLHASGFEPNYISEHESAFTAQGIKTKFLIAVKEPLTNPPAVKPPRRGGPL